MIRVTGQLICATAEDAALVTAHLPEHIRLSRAEAGCLEFNVDQTGPLIWQLDESFVDRAAFEAHQTRTRASEWYRAAVHLGRDFQISDSDAVGQDRE